VRDVEHRLTARMREHAQDTEAYLKTLRGFIATAADTIEHDDLRIAANARDLKLLNAHWARIQTALPEQVRVTLAEAPIETEAGVLVSSSDGRIRVDNTLEGRLARLRLRIQQAILERLLPGGLETGALFGG